MGSLFQFPSLIIWIIAIPLGIYFAYRQLRSRGINSDSKTAKHIESTPLSVMSLRLQSVDAISGRPAGPVETTASSTKLRQIPKYDALAITDEGLKYVKVSERLGNIHMIDPTMPHHGRYFLVKETHSGLGIYEPYEPRDAPYLSKETPQKAYRAIRWPVVDRIFTYKNGALEHINLILAGIIAVGLIILMLQIIDKLGK